MDLYVKTNVRTVNEHKYRDVERLTPTGFGDEVWDWVDTEVLTPNCGWKSESAYCGKLCDNCHIADNVKQMIEL